MASEKYCEISKLRVCSPLWRQKIIIGNKAINRTARFKYRVFQKEEDRPNHLMEKSIVIENVNHQLFYAMTNDHPLESS